MLMKKKYFLPFIICYCLLISCSVEPVKEEGINSPSRESLSLNKEVMRGRHVFEDGTIYEGELVLGKPNGFGNRELLNGDLYEGQHKDGFAHGHGTMRYKSDQELDSYVGS